MSAGAGFVVTLFHLHLFKDCILCTSCLLLKIAAVLYLLQL